MRVTIILILILSMTFTVNSAFALEELNRKQLMNLSKKERKAFLSKLDEELLKLQQRRKKALEERNQLLKVRRKDKENKNGILFNKNQNKQELYKVNPLLKKAYEMFKDYNNRNREKVVSLFDQYIKENPNSKFLPEIYYIMGTMYCGNVNVKNGEKFNLKKMREYYLKAQEGFNGKFCSYSATVYNKLNFMPGTLESRLDYYNWLLSLQENGTSDDFYGIRGIGTCIKGFSPVFSEKELEENWNHAKANNLPQIIESIEEQIFRDSFQKGRNTYLDLCILSQIYPHTKLGQQAQNALDKADRKMGIQTEDMSEEHLGLADKIQHKKEQKSPITIPIQYKKRIKDSNTNNYLEKKEKKIFNYWIALPLALILLTLLLSFFRKKQRPM